ARRAGSKVSLPRLVFAQRQVYHEVLSSAEGDCHFWLLPRNAWLNTRFPDELRFSGTRGGDPTWVRQSQMLEDSHLIANALRVSRFPNRASQIPSLVPQGLNWVHFDGAVSRQPAGD